MALRMNYALWVMSNGVPSNAQIVNIGAAPTPSEVSSGSITAVYASSITASWTPASGATSYVLAASTNSAPSPRTASLIRNRRALGW